MYFMGIDIGSLSVEVVIIDQENKILATSLVPTGANGLKSGEKAYLDALREGGINKEDIKFIVATGYGRIRVPFATKSITEITCHGIGAYYLFPNTRTVIDIGGQDSKVIRLNSSGKVVDFIMNDKCAAGTGRFLEVMARALEVEVDQLGELSLKADKTLTISSMCTVFAESEVVSLIAKGESKENIIFALHNAIASRIAGMVEHLGAEPEITMSGGVAKNIGVVKAIEKRINQSINVPPDPQMVGAFGAAILAKENFLTSQLNQDKS